MLEDIIRHRNSIITKLKIDLSQNEAWMSTRQSMPFSPTSFVSRPINQFVSVPKMLKEYPDLYQDILTKPEKEEFWTKTEIKLNELLAQETLTSQKKFAILKRFIYKILKEKHLLSKCFRKSKLQKLKKLSQTKKF